MCSQIEFMESAPGNKAFSSPFWWISYHKNPNLFIMEVTREWKGWATFAVYSHGTSEAGATASIYIARACTCISYIVDANMKTLLSFALVTDLMHRRLSRESIALMDMYDSNDSFPLGLVVTL